MGLEDLGPSNSAKSNFLDGVCILSESAYQIAPFYQFFLLEA